MNNSEKAIIYTNCINEAERLQRINSKIKSENAGNIPADLEKIIKENEVKLAFLERKVTNLFR